MKWSKLLATCCLPAMILFNACSKDDNNPVQQPTLVKEWTVHLNVNNELTAPTGRTDSGTAVLQLYSDDTLRFSLTVKNLAAGDGLTASHIHAGDAVTNGSVYIPFNGTFTNNALSGAVLLTPAQADSIQNFPMYVNIHSTQSPGGIMRGQMDKNIVFAANVVMTGANEVPPVTTTATGTTYLRLADDNTLFSKVVVADLESGDTWTAAHVHTGAPGVNGDVLVPLCNSATDFGISISSALTADVATTLLTAEVYANAHTTNHPAGIIRGQIR